MFTNNVYDHWWAMPRYMRMILLFDKLSYFIESRISLKKSINKKNYNWEINPTLFPHVATDPMTADRNKYFYKVLLRFVLSFSFGKFS